MKVAFLQTGLGAGGTEKNINLLARHRHELGDDVTVLAFKASGPSYFPYPPGIRLLVREELSGNTSADRVFGRYVWLRQHLKQLRPRVLISFLMKNNVLAVPAARGLGAAVILSERNNPAVQFADSWWPVASRIVCRHAAAFVALSADGRDALPPSIRQITRVIGNPWTSSGEMAAAGDGERVVGVGRLVAQKGFDALIEAFARIAPAHPKATLTIFGEGSHRKALEAQAAATGLGDRIRLPGQSETPAAWLRTTDIFVLSSHFEGYANVLAEAVCAGVPTIAFDCDFGPRDILEGGKVGMLVPAGDVGALAASISRVLGDPGLRAAMRDSCVEARRHNAPDLVFGMWDELVESVVRRDGAA